MNELISTLNARQSELQTALLQSQELKDSVEEFSGWLSAAENRLNLQGPVSARHKVIMDQQDKLQVCSCNVCGTRSRDEKKNTLKRNISCTRNLEEFWVLQAHKILFRIRET